jgi:uncharacterized protein (DUF1330 family)
MPKAYVILTEDIKDPDGMRAYERASMAPLLESGAVVLVVDQEPQVLEGQWHGTRTVMLEFESAVAARAWYESDSYQQVIGLRHAAAETNAVIVAGHTGPSGPQASR